MRDGLPILTRVLLLAALAVRLLVPAGWMPVAVATGGITLIPCVSAPAPKPAVVHHPPAHGHGSDKSGQHHASDERDGPEQHDMPSGECAFAPLSTAFAIPLDTFHLGFEARTADSVERSPVADPVARGPPSLLLPPATGPPART